MAREINCVLIRYGEIFLKGNNRSYFESLLVRNVKRSLEGIDCSFVRTRSRFYIENFDTALASEIVDRLSKVFGVHSVSPSVKLATDIPAIGKAAAELCPKEGKFRVTVRRADKRINMRSMDIAAEIGGIMLEGSDKLKVDLFDYDFDVGVDIRENGQTYIFFETVLGSGGLPVGCSGKAMLLLSGGIDSPVAAYLTAKRGVEVSAVHFQSFPYTSELALQKVKDLAKALSPYTGGIKLYIVPFKEIQYAIHINCREDYMITIMRRFMMRIAERLAFENGCGAIVTGESLGQVASQTMESINVTNSVVKLPVFRPLIGNDKEEIIEISKKINTFDISIRPYEDCCTVFLPKNPVIHPKLSEAEKNEEKLDVNALIEEALAGIEKVYITNN